MTTAPERTATSVTAETLVARAASIGHDASARAAEIEAAGTLPEDLVARIRNARLFAMALPSALGGVQARFTTIVEVVEELSRADASTGWATLVGNTSVFLAWLDPAVAHAVTAGGDDVVVAGSMAPTGTGRITADGYRLTGRWPFVSGSRHADWYMGGFVVLGGDGPVPSPRGGPQMRTAFFRPDQATIDPTWDVMGLCGTGSNDVMVSDIAVPAEFTAVPYADPPAFLAPITLLTPYNILMVLFAGVPLGVARRALDELVTLAAGKRRPGSSALMIEDPAVGRFMIAAEPALRAARLLVAETFDRIEDRLAGGAELTGVERAEVAAVSMHAMQVGREVTAGAFRLAGTSATARDHPLQRCRRDLAAAGQHIAFGPDLRIRTAQSLLGAPPMPALFGI